MVTRFRVPQRIVRATQDVTAYGAVPNSTSFDQTPFIQAAINAKNGVVPRGTYRIDGMLRIGNYQSLRLEHGATLLRYSAHSASDLPLVWLHGLAGTLIGESPINCVIQTQNRAPYGIIRLGHENMDENWPQNVFYNTLQGLEILGQTVYGQTTGLPDKAIWMPGPEYTPKTVNYFHWISDLRLTNVNIGMHFQNQSNGCLVRGIQGYRIGNPTLGENLNVLFWLDGCVDNSISQAFFHDSPNSITMLVTDHYLEGREVPLKTPYANSCAGIISEQSGLAARGLVCLSGDLSYYEMRNNVNQGNILHGNFFRTNILNDKQLSPTEIMAPISAAAGDGNTTLVTGMQFGKWYAVKIEETTAFDGDTSKTFRLGTVAGNDTFLSAVTATGTAEGYAEISGTLNVGGNIVLSWTNNAGAAAGELTATVKVMA